jgi:hypothetical protein
MEVQVRYVSLRRLRNSHGCMRVGARADVDAEQSKLHMSLLRWRGAPIIPSVILAEEAVDKLAKPASTSSA